MVIDAKRASRADLLAEYLMCAQSFPYFLRYVKLRDSNRGVIPMQLWPHVIQVAEDWQTGESWLEGKARQLGFSWELAAYDVWILLFREMARILSISAGERESVELLEKVKFIHRNLPPFLYKRPSTDNASSLAIAATGAEMRALPSTENAGRSFQATLVQLDEAAFHPYAGENYAAYHPAVADGGQEIFVTTGNGPSGLFFDFFNDPTSGYRKRFTGWRARPDRDDDWYARELAAFTAAGERHPLLFKRENPETVEEMFAAFFGLVYDMFEESRHVKAEPFAWKDAQYRVAGVDPGQGDPCAVTPIGELNEHAHQFDEMYRQGVTTYDEIADYLIRWHLRAPFNGIFVDSIEGTLIATLRAKGLPAYPANKERGIGIGHVAGRLANETFTVSPDCRHTIREFHSYRWKERRTPGEADPYATSTPQEHHGDAMDGDRYALVGLSQFFSGRKRETAYPTFAPVKPKDDPTREGRDPLAVERAKTGKVSRTPLQRPDFSHMRRMTMRR